MNATIHIKTHHLCPSMNLSHSVTVACYTISQYLSQKHDITQKEEISESDQFVSAGDIFKFTNYLIDNLRSTDFFRTSEKSAKMITRIRNMFVKIPRTQKEVNILYGIINCLRDKKGKK